MDSKEEYQDPDYHESGLKKSAPELTAEEKLEKIKRIIRREFANELEVREKEVTLIDQRLTTARRILHKLRYALVNNFFKQEQLQLSSAHLQDDLDALSQVQAKPELSTLLRDGQRRIHPSLRKLLGKDTVDLEEIFKTRETRKKRKDYQAMVNSKNTTIAVGNISSLRPVKPRESADMEFHQPVSEELPKEPDTKPKKVPRHLDPKIVDVFTIDEATRNKMKQRYRIIIGNTSKYAPGASRADRSTHKWLLYVRGPASNPDPSAVLRAAVVRLHHSYAPHHTVHLHKPPFHVSRRGWGEFPAKIELHFALPDRNRPATVEHTIKLDRNYTGLQTLGAETVVDVWLYSTPEMLEFEYKEPIGNDINTTHDTTQHDTQKDTQNPLDIDIKQEIDDFSNDTDSTADNWMDFFAKNTTEVNVDEMLVTTSNKNNFENVTNTEQSESEIEFRSKTNCYDDKTNIPVVNQVEKKRIVKYVEPNTGKIYYLEMDRNVDLSKVQELIIESESGVTKAKISPMKSNGLRHDRKKDKSKKIDKKERQNVLSHIENDHCYYCPERVKEECESDNEEELDIIKTIQEDVMKLNNVRAVIDYMLKKIPIISKEARKESYSKHFPFVVENEEWYWKLDFAKRRNIEWSRAKLINKMLIDKFGATEAIWRTKQILIYSRLHGYYPIRTKSVPTQPEIKTEEWSSWNDPESSRKETNIKEILPKPSDVSTLSVFDSKEFLPYTSSEYIDLTDCEEEIDVVDTREFVKPVLPEVKDVGSLRVLPVESSEDRLRFLYVEKKCADIGIELRNEDVGNGCSYSAVHAVILSAMKSFAEELIRSALANKLSEQRNLEYLPSVWVGSSSQTVISLEHVYLGLVPNPRLHALTARALAAERQDTTEPL